MRIPMKGVGGLQRSLLSFDEIFDPKGDKLCSGNLFTMHENGTNENLSSKSKIHQSCHETQRIHEGEWARYLNRRQLMRTSTSSEISCVPETYDHPLMRCQHTHAIEFGKNTYYRVCMAECRSIKSWPRADSKMPPLTDVGMQNQLSTSNWKH